MGELFYDIQFGSMTLREFDAISLAYDSVFSFEEHKEILHMIANPQFETKYFNKMREEFFMYDNSDSGSE